jgi:hypothetical protein
MFDTIGDHEGNIFFNHRNAIFPGDIFGVCDYNFRPVKLGIQLHFFYSAVRDRRPDNGPVPHLGQRDIVHIKCGTRDLADAVKPGNILTNTFHARKL